MPEDERKAQASRQGGKKFHSEAFSRWAGAKKDRLAIDFPDTYKLIRQTDIEDLFHAEIIRCLP